MSLKKCPKCAEKVKWDAKLCKHCSYEFTAEEMAAARSEQKAGIIGAGIFIVLACLGVAMCSGGGEPETPEQVAQKAAEEAENKRKGFHCLSAWDGSSRQFVDKVKSKLRDPSSFEHVSTKITPVKDGKHIVIMEYRAKNGFGGMNIEQAMGLIDHETCAAELTIAG